jgi:hypothetical protein
MKDFTFEELENILNTPVAITLKEPKGKLINGTIIRSNISKDVNQNNTKIPLHLVFRNANNAEVKINFDAIEKMETIESRAI